MTSPASTSILSWPATPGAETNRTTGASSGENSVNDFTPKTPNILAKPTSNSATPGFSLPQQTVYSRPHCLASSSAEDAGAASSAVADVGDSAASDVIMTLLLTSTHVSAAAYDMDLGVLHGIPDQVEFDDLRTIRKIVGQVAPTRIVVTSTAPRRLLDALKQLGVVDQQQQGAGLNETASYSSTLLSTLVLPEWDFKICLSRLLELPEFRGKGGRDDRETRLIRLDSVLSLDNKLLIRSLGALLGFLFKNRAGGIMLDAEGGVGVFVASLQLLKLDQVLGLDKNTFDALRIFKRVNHPSTSLKSGAVKDSDCLFFLANCCKSKPGSCLLRSWFLRPSSHLAEIRRRHSGVSFFLAYFTSAADARVKELKRHLSRVGSVARMLSKMATSTPATHSDLLLLSRTLVACLRVVDLLGDVERQLGGGGESGGSRREEGLTELMALLRATASEDVAHVAEILTKALDLEAMEEEKKIVIRAGVDDRLDELNGLLQVWPEYLGRIVRRQIRSLPEFVGSCNIVYLNQIGFLVQIPRQDCDGKEIQLQEQRVEILFSHDDISYCKTPTMRMIDGEYESVVEAIETRERDILRQLQQFVVAESAAISKLVAAVARVDALLSLANFARNCNLIKPEMVDDAGNTAVKHSISFKDSRHILQETFVDGVYVPNDYFSGGDSTTIKILTGPNASGKSVYLCQVALAVFLSHLGSFVPAAHARLGVVDRIFTRINSEESISACTSSWGCDLGQVAVMLKESTSSSLVILDEFGKGTDSTSGCALLAALINHWARSPPAQTPHVLLATHFHEITRRSEDGQRGVFLANLNRLTFLVMDFVGEEAVEASASGQRRLGISAIDRTGQRDRRSARDASFHASTTSSSSSSSNSKTIRDIVFLYRVVEGSHPFSHALQIAKSLNLGDDVIERAVDVLNASTGGEPLEPLVTERHKSREERNKRLMEEILKREEIKEGDIEELRTWVRELESSGDSGTMLRSC